MAVDLLIVGKVSAGSREDKKCFIGAFTFIEGEPGMGIRAGSCLDVFFCLQGV